VRDVSRETQPPPAAAARVFGDSWPQAQRYAALLGDAGVTRGLIGPREVGRLWDRHLLNCAAIGPDIASCSRVCDVGSGAGLPGLVLALARPDLQVTLLEPLLRRATFLQEAVELLQLTDVEVVRSRAEDLRGRSFDVVTARAVAPMSRLAGWTLPLCRPGGLLLALKGRSAAAELAEAVPVLRRLKAASWGVRSYPVVGVDTPALAVAVVTGGRDHRRPAGKPTEEG
jgi:16S rRNA (guanine527-N7)-methyltransferase